MGADILLLLLNMYDLVVDDRFSKRSCGFLGALNRVWGWFSSVVFGYDGNCLLVFLRILQSGG